MAKTSYFDTSVLLPALNMQHVLHAPCLQLLRSAANTGTVVSTALHTYAELYTHLTKPAKLNIHLPPLRVADLLIDQLPTTLQLIELQRHHYDSAIRRCAGLQLVSAIVYEALHLEAALSAGAQVLYTHNTKDFHRLLTPDDPIRIKGIR